MSQSAHYADQHAAAPAGDNPWSRAAEAVLRQARAHVFAIVGAAVACGVAGAAIKAILPTKYKATVQILIDPRGFQLATSEAVTGQIDANSAINFVESQLGVLHSDRVLLRVLRDEQPAGENLEQNGDKESRALIALQKALAVTRAERSFLVDVSVTDADPAFAAKRANAIVKAYIDIEVVDRNATAKRLASELSERVDGLRHAVNDAETNLEKFRRDHNLVGLNERLVIEKRITEASASLSAAEARETQLRARMDQIEKGPLNLNVVGAMGTDPESRTLTLLIDSISADRAEISQLASVLGEKHPSLASARERMTRNQRRLDDAVHALRKSVRNQYDRAHAEKKLLSNTLEQLSSQLTKVREDEIEMHSLASTLDGNRKILDSFETRSREAREFGQIDLTQVRVVSPALPPVEKGRLFGIVAFGGLGALGGGLLALAGFAFFGAWPAAQGGAARNAFFAGDESKNTPAHTARGARREQLLEPRFRRAIDTLLMDVLNAGRRRKSSTSVLTTARRDVDGKSDIAVTLAFAAAARRLNTLLIDADIAHPSLSHLVERQAPTGLVNVSGKWRPVWRLVDDDDLTVMPALDDEDEICRRLQARKDCDFIDGIAHNFDFVVFDGARVEMDQEIREIAEAVDHIVIAAPREGYAPGEFDRLVRRLGAPRKKCRLFPYDSLRPTR